MFPTPYECALCRGRVIRDQWTATTHADNDGNPVERTGYGYYCENEKCPMHVEAMETEDMLTTEEPEEMDDVLTPIV